jgi:hypothetical protein
MTSVALRNMYGGIVGLTRKKSALVRWTLTSIFSSEMRERSELVTDCAEFYQETKPAAMKRDDQQVTDLIDHIVNKMTDPFDVALQMANSPASNAALISTGILSMSSKYTGVHLE